MDRINENKEEKEGTVKIIFAMVGSPSHERVLQKIGNTLDTIKFPNKKSENSNNFYVTKNFFSYINVCSSSIGFGNEEQTMQKMVNFFQTTKKGINFLKNNLQLKKTEESNVESDKIKNKIDLAIKIYSEGVSQAKLKGCISLLIK